MAYSRYTGLTLAGWLLIVCATGADTGRLAPHLSPNPGLTAADVVRIQLTALASNDSPRPDAGIEITFRFASPKNKQVTGPLSRFIELVKSAAYRPMLNHLHREFGEPVVEYDQTVLPVVLTAADNEKLAYIFMLSRQTGATCNGCWMTESVVPVDIGHGYQVPPEKVGI